MTQPVAYCRYVRRVSIFIDLLILHVLQTGPRRGQLVWRSMTTVRWRKHGSVSPKLPRVSGFSDGRAAHLSELQQIIEHKLHLTQPDHVQEAIARAVMVGT